MIKSIGHDKNDMLKGQRVVIIFKKVDNFDHRTHGSGAHKKMSATFKGNVDNPVVCTIESTFHKKR